MNSYELSRKFIDWAFENPSKIKPNHYALYFFSIEHCNRLGWKKEFGLPSIMSMEATGIKSHNTYMNTFNDLIEFGFFNCIERSKNQYSSNIIALSNFDKALDKALDKAFIKHSTKQSESTIQSIDNINKPITINKEQINNNKEFDLFWSKYPKKVGKSNCERIFSKLSNTDKQKILSTIDKFISFKPFNDYKHPNPQTYLNGKRWEDEIDDLKPEKKTNEQILLDNVNEQIKKYYS